MYDVMEMEDSFYINDVGVGRAFGKPCLPLAAATRSPTFQDLLDEGECKSLETRTTIFRHLCNRAKDAKAFTPVQGQRTADDVEDRGLVNFYTALMTPGRVALDSLNSSKRMRYDDTAMDEGEGSLNPGATSRSSSVNMDEPFGHLRNSLALVKGELGWRVAEAPYATVHGGLQGAYTALAKFEAQLNSKASSAMVDDLVTDTNACYDKSAEACHAVEQLVTLGGISKVVALEHKLRDMGACTRVIESTLDRASRLMEDLSAYVANLAAGSGCGVPTPGVGVAAAYFLVFKATQEQAVTSIRQELKGGRIMLGGVEFDGKDAYMFL